MALSANAIVESRGEGGIVALGLKTATTMFRGAIAGIEAATGFLRPATATATPDRRGGIVREGLASGSAASGSVLCEVYTEGEFLLTGSGFAQTDVGLAVYASDDNTITKTSTNNMLLGTITRFVSSTQVWVKLLPFGVAS